LFDIWLSIVVSIVFTDCDYRLILDVVFSWLGG